MQATLMTRQPAPALARAGARLRRCVRANAFGNALGSSLASAASGVINPATNDGATRVDGLTFSQDTARRQMANNSYGLPTQATPVMRDFDPDNQWDAGALGPIGGGGDNGDPFIVAQANQTRGTRLPSAPAPTLTSTDWKQQAATLGKQATQLLDAAEWARKNGMPAAAQDYQEAGIKAYYAGQKASMEALDITSASIASIEPAKPVNLFASGEFGAGKVATSNPNWILDFESNASLAGHVALGSQWSALGGAKYNALGILQRAAPLHGGKQLLIGTAETLGDAAAIFKSPNGASAQSLIQASAKYSVAIKSLAFAGAAANVAEETAFVVRSSEAGFNYMALGASATNVAGDVLLTLGGVKLGAMVGAAGGPFAPITIPLGAATFGFLGHYGWDSVAKPFYREVWTGVPEPKQ